MFPTRESRLRTALHRSLDAAIEFATLGEYGWAPAWDGPGASARSASAALGADALAVPAQAARHRIGAQPQTALADRPTPELLRPASAAGRARRNEQAREAAHCGGQPLRGRALDPHLPRKARSRDGMAPREQRCLPDAA